MPESSLPSPQEKARSFHLRFMGFMREMILEGVVDPNEGTSFTVLQTDVHVAMDLQDGLQEAGRVLFQVGIPNPLEVEFDDLTLSPEEKKAREDRLAREILGDLWDEGDDDDQNKKES